MLKDNKLLKEYQLRIGFQREGKKIKTHRPDSWVAVFCVFFIGAILTIFAFPNIQKESNTASICDQCLHVRALRASFDDLKNAQKEINRDLGLPPSPQDGAEKPSTNPENSRRHSQANPWVGWSFVAIAVLGIASLFLILRKERREIQQFEQNPLAILSTDREPVFAESGKRALVLPELQRPRTDLESVSFPPFPEATKTTEEETTALTGKLDQFLNGMREQTGLLKDRFELTVQRFDPKLKSFFRVGQSTGKDFPAEHVLGFLTEDMASAWKGIHFTEWEKIPLVKGDGITPMVFSIVFPFFDNKGQLYALTVSCMDCPDLPTTWFEGFKEFIPDIQKILLDYPILRYTLPTETRNNEGDLDIRAVENRAFLEIQKGVRLGTVFTLVFIKLASSGKTSTASFLENELFPRFKRSTESVLRHGDAMTIMPGNVVFILFPETNKVEAHYVMERILDQFESLLEEHRNTNIKLFSNVIEWKQGSETSPQTLIREGLRFDIPMEKSDEQHMLEHLRENKSHPSASGPDHL